MYHPLLLDIAFENVKFFPLDSMVPQSSLPLCHIILGLGFPSVGQESETELPSDIRIVRQFSVAVGGSKQIKERRLVKKGFRIENIAIVEGNILC